jgi:hypothetical protein
MKPIYKKLTESAWDQLASQFGRFHDAEIGQIEICVSASARNERDLVLVLLASGHQGRPESVSFLFRKVNDLSISFVGGVDYWCVRCGLAIIFGNSEVKFATDAVAVSGGDIELMEEPVLAGNCAEVFVCYVPEFEFEPSARAFETDLAGL